MSNRLHFLHRKLGLDKLGRYAPAFSLALERGALAEDDFYQSLPFRRSPIAILIAAAFFALFTVPLFTVGGFLEGSGDDSLFSLVFMLFSLFWLLGWCSGLMVLLSLLLCLCAGRETVHVSNNKLTLRIGIPGIAFGASYSGELIRNFRYRDSDIPAARQWRGAHIEFDYGGIEIGLGSALSSVAAQELIAWLQAAFPQHAEAPREIEQAEPAPAEIEVAAKPQQVESAPVAQPLRWYSVSSVALILANLIPLAGVLLAAWNIGEIMLLFWAESAIIGYYNLLKMWKVGRWSLLFFGPFFVGHYGAFMAVHLLFIYALFGGEFLGETEVTQLQVFNDLLTLWPALLGLTISHGISYYRNFVRAGEFKGRTISTQMHEPYRRIIIMHMTLIFGGFLVLSLGTGLAALALLLSLKIAADLRAHLKQHS